MADTKTTVALHFGLAAATLFITCLFAFTDFHCSVRVNPDGESSAYAGRDEAR